MLFDTYVYNILNNILLSIYNTTTYVQFWMTMYLPGDNRVWGMQWNNS